MAEVDWAILCDYAFLDVGRKTCIIGAFAQIFAQAVPAQHPQVALVVRFTGQPSENFKTKMEIVRPIASGGGTIGAVNNELKIGENGALEFTTNIVGLPLPDWGDYAFNIYVDDQLAKTVTFSVKEIPKQVSGGEKPPPRAN